MTGTMPQHQVLKLRLSEGHEVEMGHDSSTLTDYGAKDGMEILVDDTNPLSIAREAGLSDLSQIEKYVMSDEAYNKMDGTVRQFLREKFKSDPEYRKKVFELRQQRQQEVVAEQNALRQMSVGMRCRTSGDTRGEVAYLGEVPSFGKGPVVGVRLDEPLGDSDGTHGGVRYFEAQRKHGVFLKPSAVEVGDFPELSFNSSPSEL